MIKKYFDVMIQSFFLFFIIFFLISTFYFKVIIFKDKNNDKKVIKKNEIYFNQNLKEKLKKFKDPEKMIDKLHLEFLD